MSDDVKAPCLVCDREADDEVFCPSHLRRAARIVSRSHPLRMLLLAAMEITESAGSEDAGISDAYTMINRVIGPTTLSHVRCLELDAMPGDDERVGSLVQEYGSDGYRLAWVLYRYERKSWIPADYMSA